MLTFLPALVVALANPHVPVDAPAHALQTRTQAARAQLATVLADADAIDWVAANGPTITFGIERGDTTLHVVVTTRARGEVVSLVVEPARHAPHDLGSLSWLADELRDASAIEQLAVDSDGAITIATSDGRRYMAIPGRGSGGAGNTGVEARWAAEWETDAPQS